MPPLASVGVGNMEIFKHLLVTISSDIPGVHVRVRNSPRARENIIVMHTVRVILLACSLIYPNCPQWITCPTHLKIA